MNPQHRVLISLAEADNLKQSLQTLADYIEGFADPAKAYLQRFVAPAEISVSTAPWQDQVKQVSRLYNMVYPFVLNHYLRDMNSVPEDFVQQINIFISLSGPVNDNERTIENAVQIFTSCSISLRELQILCDYYNHRPLDPRTADFYSYITFVTAYATALNREVFFDPDTDDLAISPSASLPVDEWVEFTDLQLQQLLLLSTRSIELVPQTEETAAITALLRNVCHIQQPGKRLRILAEAAHLDIYGAEIARHIPVQGDTPAMKNQKLIALLKANAPTANLAYYKANLVMEYFGNDLAIAGAAIRRIRSIAAAEFDEIELAAYDNLLLSNRELHALSLRLPSNLQARHYRSLPGVTALKAKALSRFFCLSSLFTIPALAASPGAYSTATALNPGTIATH